MAKIDKMPGGKIRVNVNLYYFETEFEMLENYRINTEEYLRKKGYLKDMQFTLDDAVFYIVGEVLSGNIPNKYCAFVD